jgi:hypothetical protein
MNILYDTWFKLKIDIGATVLCLLYGWNVYNANNDTVRPTAPNLNPAHITHSLHQIRGGWTAAR